MSRRVLVAAVVAVLLSGAVVGIASRGGGEARSAPPSQLSDLENLGQLEALFNAAAGMPRLVVLLSPS
jgi:hypothetical protein